MFQLVKRNFAIIAMGIIYFALAKGELVEIKIEAKVEQKAAINPVGAVYGAKACESAGKFIQWRFSICNTTDSPCHIPDGLVVDGEFTFIPSKTVEKLAFRMSATVNGSEPRIIADHPLEYSKMIGGVEQTIHVPGIVPDEYKGMGVLLTKQKNELYRIDDKVVEMCVEADLLFW